MGRGAIQSISTKQKINTRSSTEAELVSFDDIVSKVLWTKLFLEAQGYPIEQNLVYRDNQSAMKLELNGKASSGKRTRHFNIKYFFVTDLIHRKELSIEYCPTDAMLADYMTKPLMGEKFELFRNEIMNLGKSKEQIQNAPKRVTFMDKPASHGQGQKECVGAHTMRGVKMNG